MQPQNMQFNTFMEVQYLWYHPNWDRRFVANWIVIVVFDVIFSAISWNRSLRYYGLGIRKLLLVLDRVLDHTSNRNTRHFSIFFKLINVKVIITLNCKNRSVGGGKQAVNKIRYRQQITNYLLTVYLKVVDYLGEH